MEIYVLVCYQVRIQSIYMMQMLVLNLMPSQLSFTELAPC